MSNSNTPLSKTQRALSSIKAKKESKLNGNFLQIGVSLWGKEYVELWKNIPCKANFIKNALKNLDNEGNPK